MLRVKGSFPHRTEKATPLSVKYITSRKGNIAKLLRLMFKPNVMCIFQRGRTRLVTLGMCTNELQSVATTVLMLAAALIPLPSDLLTGRFLRLSSDTEKREQKTFKEGNLL